MADKPVIPSDALKPSDTPTQPAMSAVTPPLSVDTRLKSVEDRLGSAESRIGDVERHVSTVEAKVDDGAKKYEALASDVATLRSDVSTVKDLNTQQTETLSRIEVDAKAERAERAKDSSAIKEAITALVTQLGTALSSPTVRHYAMALLIAVTTIASSVAAYMTARANSVTPATITQPAPKGSQ